MLSSGAAIKLMKLMCAYKAIRLSILDDYR